MSRLQTCESNNFPISSRQRHQSSRAWSWTERTLFGPCIILYATLSCSSKKKQRRQTGRKQKQLQALTLNRERERDNMTRFVRSRECKVFILLSFVVSGVWRRQEEFTKHRAQNPLSVIQETRMKSFHKNATIRKSKAEWAEQISIPRYNQITARLCVHPALCSGMQVCSLMFNANRNLLRWC